MDTRVATRGRPIADYAFPGFDGRSSLSRSRSPQPQERASVHGITNLRIADASVRPSITPGNTTAPVLAIAERAASLIIDQHATTAAELQIAR